jgi:thioredoxin-related protein
MIHTLRLITGFLALVAFSSCSSAGVEVPASNNLSELGQQAEKGRLPIMMMVSQAHCGFCEKLKEEILEPMLISGDYTDKVIITELLMDSYTNITGFDGSEIHPSDIASSYKVWVTPTLLFLNADGNEVHPRMLGVNTIEMYGYYIDESINGAMASIRDPDAKPYTPSAEDMGVTDLTNSAM